MGGNGGEHLKTVCQVGGGGGGGLRRGDTQQIPCNSGQGLRISRRGCAARDPSKDTIIVMAKFNDNAHEGSMGFTYPQRQDSELHNLQE